MPQIYAKHQNQANRILVLTLPRIQAKLSLLIFTQLSYKAVRADTRNIPFTVTLLGKSKRAFISWTRCHGTRRKRERGNGKKSQSQKRFRQASAVSSSLINKPKGEQARHKFSRKQRQEAGNAPPISTTQT